MSVLRVPRVGTLREGKTEELLQPKVDGGKMATKHILHFWAGFWNRNEKDIDVAVVQIPIEVVYGLQ
jgi:hypothetical protein